MPEPVPCGSNNLKDVSQIENPEVKAIEDSFFGNRAQKQAQPLSFFLLLKKIEKFKSKL